MKHIKLRIRGRVQGVGYRAHTRRKAQELGLLGFVQNEPDGSVYAEIAGPEPAVDAMIAWCLQGPPLAEVEAIHIEEGPAVSYEGFEVRR